MSYLRKRLARIKNILNRPKGWQKFAKEARSRPEGLLRSLARYRDAILVSGCQRSGGTMMARTITLSDGLVNYWFGEDEELDAALILAGAVAHEPRGRYCFQTTYLNERYTEYFDRDKRFKLVWMLRNPESVAYSMVYNWSDFALNELFSAVGMAHLADEDKERISRAGLHGLSPIRRAAYAYVGKVSQLFELVPGLGAEKMAVVAYEPLTEKPHRNLPGVYDYLGLSYRSEYADRIHDRSAGKSDLLDPGERAVIQRICGGTYERAQTFQMSV